MVGAKSNPPLQFVACSGWSTKLSGRTPGGRSSNVFAPPRPMPMAGAEPQAKSREENSFAAAEPGVGAPSVQEMLNEVGVVLASDGGVLKPTIAVLKPGEYSPAFAKRNDVPQDPL